MLTLQAFGALSEGQRKGLMTCFSGLDASPGVTVQPLAGVPLVRGVLL